MKCETACPKYQQGYLAGMPAHACLKHGRSNIALVCTPEEAVSQQGPGTDTQTQIHTDARMHAHQGDALRYVALKTHNYHYFSIEPDQRG